MKDDYLRGISIGIISATIFMYLNPNIYSAATMLLFGLVVMLIAYFK